jgi:mono/diheme cytochrome c family protein
VNKLARLRLALFALVLTTIQMVILVPVMSRLKTEKPLGPVYARADIEAGRAVYQDNCAACHGSAGRGNPAMAAAMKGLDLSKAAGKSPDAIGSIIRNGKDQMPAFKELTDEQVRQLVDFVRSLGGEK